MNILIIEDEPKVVSFLKMGLEEQGYHVEVAFDGLTGERMLVNKQLKFDLVIMDIMLPYQNGYELCQKARAFHPHIPIIMLSALGTTDDKVKGFDLGADDYLVKPFEFVELLARIKALTKRSSGILHTSHSIKIADLELDMDKKKAIRDGKPIELTAKEYSLLEMLMRNKGRILSREEIAEKVWEITFDTGTNVVDVYINFLRKKVDKDFEPKLIQTKVGMGYMIDCED